MRVTSRAALLCVLLGASAAYGQPPVAPEPKPVPDARRVPAVAEAEAAAPVLFGPSSFTHLAEVNVKNVPKGTGILWDVLQKDEKGRLYRAAVDKRVIQVERALLFAGPPGSYQVECTLVAGENSQRLYHSVTITGAAPTPPVPPTPPTPPTPDPKPPEPKPPTPKPDEAPIDAEGLHVLVVYETSEVSKLASPTRQVIFAKEIRQYLDEKCAKDPTDPDTPQRRIWDPDVNAAADSPLWDAALKRAKAKIAEWKPAANGTGPQSPYPWIMISKKGVGGYEGPLPVSPNNTAQQNVAATLALLRKFGG